MAFPISPQQKNKENINGLTVNQFVALNWSHHLAVSSSITEI